MTPSGTETATPFGTLTDTPTPGIGTDTATPTVTETGTETVTPFGTLTDTPTPGTGTDTATPSVTETGTETATPFGIMTDTPTLTPSQTATETATPSASPSPTYTPGFPADTPTSTPAVVPSPEHGKSFIFPSPARGARATIVFQMAGAGACKIRIFNLVGDRVDTIEERKGAGRAMSILDLSDLAPGTYYYILNLTYDSGMTENLAPHKFVVLK